MNHFAEMLRNYRLHRGLPQAQLADKLGVRYQTVSKWETAATLPDTAMSHLVFRVSHQQKTG